MVRRQWLISIAAFVGLSVAHAAGTQSVDDLVAKNLQAKGGLEKIRAVRSMKRTGRLVAGSFQVGFVVSAKRPGMVRQELNLAGQTLVVAYDGTTAWKVDPLSGSDAPVTVDGSEAEAIRDDADFDGPLVDHKSKGSTIELVGSETIDRRPVHHLKVTGPDRRVTHIYLDVETGLEARIVSQVGPRTVTHEFSDYRDVNGVKVPFAIRTLNNNALEGQVIVDRIELNVTLDDAIFRRPGV